MCKYYNSSINYIMYGQSAPAKWCLLLKDRPSTADRSIALEVDLIDFDVCSIVLVKPAPLWGLLPINFSSVYQIIQA